jgi:hypothetical protein
MSISGTEDKTVTLLLLPNQKELTQFHHFLFSGFFILATIEVTATVMNGGGF